MNVDSSKFLVFIFLVFINLAIELCQCLPLYFSKYSRKDFTVHQLLILLVIKQKLKCSYETLIDDLKTKPFVIQLIGLKKLPHSNTLKKFVKRLKAEIIYYLLEDCTARIKKNKLRLAIATPFFGTRFYKRLKQEGHLFDPDLTKWDTGHLVYDHKDISPERMIELQHQIVTDFYKSPQWDKRMHEMAKNNPRLRQSIEEFREYIFSHLKE